MGVLKTLLAGYVFAWLTLARPAPVHVIDGPSTKASSGISSIELPSRLSGPERFALPDNMEEAVVQSVGQKKEAQTQASSSSSASSHHASGHDLIAPRPCVMFKYGDEFSRSDIAEAKRICLAHQSRVYSHFAKKYRTNAVALPLLGPQLAAKAVITAPGNIYRAARDKDIAGVICQSTGMCSRPCFFGPLAVPIMTCVSCFLSCQMGCLAWQMQRQAKASAEIEEKAEHTTSVEVDPEQPLLTQSTTERNAKARRRFEQLCAELEDASEDTRQCFESANTMSKMYLRILGGDDLRNLQGDDLKTMALDAVDRRQGALGPHPISPLRSPTDLLKQVQQARLASSSDTRGKGSSSGEPVSPARAKGV